MKSKVVRFYESPKVVQTEYPELVLKELEGLPMPVSIEINRAVASYGTASVRETRRPICEYNWYDKGVEHMVYVAFREDEDYDVMRRIVQVNEQNRQVISVLRNETEESQRNYEMVVGQNKQLKGENDRQTKRLHLTMDEAAGYKIILLSCNLSGNG